ncbi:MAG TPA: MotE family protein [Hyphomicrobium sp.]|nr:MotE family protein [Hyphomicrobium sp.]
MTALSAQSLARTARFSRFTCFAGVIGVAVVLAVPAFAADNAKADKERQAADSLPLPPTTPPQQMSAAEQYCSSVIDAAAAAQIAQQTSNLEKARKELAERVALLDAKTAELKSWVKKRTDFTAHATDSLIEIYSKMKPDAAASQLASMDELTAAAITSKLPPKVSSLMLAEMDAKKAARLTAIIAGAAEMATKLESMANAQHQ